MVEHSSHHPKVDGSSATVGASTGRKKMAKNLPQVQMTQKAIKKWHKAVPGPDNVKIIYLVNLDMV